MAEGVDTYLQYSQLSDDLIDGFVTRATTQATLALAIVIVQAKVYMPGTFNPPP